MNTGFVRPAIAIVLTACGIETEKTPQKRLSFSDLHCNSTYRLRY